MPEHRPDVEDDSTEIHISLVAPLNIVLRRRRLVATAGVIAGVMALALGILTRKYGADSDFTPSATSATSSSLLSLASQFGVGSSLLGATGESVDFYADLVKSREVLTATALTTFRFPTDVGGRDSIVGTLVDIYHPRGATSRDRLQRAVKMLDQSVSADADETSNIVSVRVRARWPALAELVNARILELVNEFNVERRASQASLERKFVEQRLAQSLGDLTGAEDDLKNFLERNRSYQGSPSLQFEESRLQRRVDLRQQLYTTLAQAYDQSRIDEVRNTPVVTILDHPEGSARPTRSWALIVLGAVLLGGIGGVGSAFVDELVSRQREENPRDYAAFHEAWANIRLNPFRRRRLTHVG